MFKFVLFISLLAVKAHSTIVARVLVYVADCIVYYYAFTFPTSYPFNCLKEFSSTAPAKLHLFKFVAVTD